MSKTKETKKEEPIATRRGDLAQFGLLVGMSDELAERIKKRAKFYSTLKAFDEDCKGDDNKILPPSGQIMNLLRALTKVDNTLKVTSTPWGRGADTKWFSVAMLGWEGLLAKARNDILICYNVVLEKEKDGDEDWILVRQLRAFLMSAVLKYAQYIEDVSYSDKDVAPKYVPVIQIPQSSGYAGGPAPRPSSFNFPT